MSLLAVIALVKLELKEVERTVNICIKRKARWKECIVMGLEDILVDSIASCLHSFYTGIEKIFEIIAVEIDQGLPHGDRWHVKLLKLMKADIPGVRCSVLSEQSVRDLDQFRSFRHLFRNIYTHNIIPQKVMSMCDELEVTWKNVKSDMDEFIRVIEENTYEE
ncbi:HepT-like domain-containing protein [Candidatus Magnetomoraceae bacterium gMMP-1]